MGQVWGTGQYATPSNQVQETDLVTDHNNSYYDNNNNEDANGTDGVDWLDVVLIGGMPVADVSVTLHDFDMLKVIGRGSFAKVIQVRKKDTGKIYAMKVMRKDGIIARKKGVVHTRSERTVLEIAKHPFIVNLNFAFQTKDKLYMILDYLNGGELFYHLKREYKFNEERAKFYTGELVLAIDFLHSKGILYRDLKPENILLDKDGHICLTDFGLAKEDLTREMTTNSFCGTAEYMAPEVVKRQGYSWGVDWWSLGNLLYEMLSGLPPFYASNTDKLYKNILEKELVFPSDFSQEAVSLLSGLLERDVNRRLGCGPHGAEDIKAHIFFKGFPWDAVLRKEVTPPFRPTITRGDGDISNFDPRFTRERIFRGPIQPIVEDTDPNIPDTDPTKPFLNYSYVNPDLIADKFKNLGLDADVVQRATTAATSGMLSSSSTSSKDMRALAQKEGWLPPPPPPESSLRIFADEKSEMTRSDSPPLPNLSIIANPPSSPTSLSAAAARAVRDV